LRRGVGTDFRKQKSRSEIIAGGFFLPSLGRFVILGSGRTFLLMLDMSVSVRSQLTPASWISSFTTGAKSSMKDAFLHALSC
jgi:hypothetical protein